MTDKAPLNENGGPKEHLSADGVIRKCSAPNEASCRAGSKTEVASVPVPPGMTPKAKEAWREKMNASRDGGNALKSHTKEGTKRKSSATVLHNFVEPKITQIEGYLGAKGWAGAKSDFSYNTAEIAKAVRADIKEAKKAGWLPEDIKVSVRSRDNAVDTLVDFGRENDDYMYELHPVTDGDYVRGYKLKKDYQETLDRVESIVNNYNYNTSNLQADYHNRGFYGNTRGLTHRERLLNRVDKLSKEVKRAKKAGIVDPFLEGELNDAVADYRIEKTVDERVFRTLEDASTFGSRPVYLQVSPEQLIKMIDRRALRAEAEGEYFSSH